MMGNKHLEGHRHTEESKKKMSEIHKGKLHTEESKKKISATKKGEKHTKEHNKKVSEARKRNWQDPEYRDKQIKVIFKGLQSKPTKPEIQFDNILQQLLPNEYKYVGDGEILIGYKCPDFMNVNGQKKLIELYGDYWHRNDNPQDRIDHFAKYGYKCLVVWEHELKALIPLKKKILEFHCN